MKKIFENSVIFKAVNENVLVKWADNHQSSYSYEWLKGRSFSKEAQKCYMENIYQPSRVLWDKGEFTDILHIYEYEEVITKYVKCTDTKVVLVYLFVYKERNVSSVVKRFGHVWCGFNKKCTYNRQKYRQKFGKSNSIHSEVTLWVY